MPAGGDIHEHLDFAQDLAITYMRRPRLPGTGDCWNPSRMPPDRAPGARRHTQHHSPVLHKAQAAVKPPRAPGLGPPAPLAVTPTEPVETPVEAFMASRVCLRPDRGLPRWVQLRTRG